MLLWSSDAFDIPPIALLTWFAALRAMFENIAALRTAFAAHSGHTTFSAQYLIAPGCEVLMARPAQLCDILQLHWSATLIRPLHEYLVVILKGSLNFQTTLMATGTVSALHRDATVSPAIA